VLRFYFDEDSMPRALVRACHANGIDGLSTTETDRRGTPDNDQLTFATNEGRVIMTRNIADFAVLHAQTIESGREHAGILAIPPEHYTTGQYLRALQRLSDAFTPEEMANRLVFLGNWL